MAKVSLVHNSNVEEACQIFSYLHCQKCLQERPEDVSPAEWARLNVGMTPKGIQIWCERHRCSVDHIKFTTGPVDGVKFTK